MEEIEIEKKFLIKNIPDLNNLKSKKLVDIYIPRKEGHAAIRIRQQGDKFFITKKTPLSENELKEETIEITEDDFNIFRSMTEAKVIDKTRYYLPFSTKTIEIDVFNDKLKGLILAEIEFSTKEELNSFKIPDFCIKDVTNEDFLAGGVLCGKTYVEIQDKITEILRD